MSLRRRSSPSIARAQSAPARISVCACTWSAVSSFSRDQVQKVYVQDRMRENGAELWQWIVEGAAFYVCGDAKRMAKDVEVALVDIVAQHGVRSTEEAVAFVSELKKKGRYQQDVY